MSDDAQRFRSILSAALADLGVDVDDRQLSQLLAHYQAMLVANQVMNLTRITDPEEAAIKHYADSLAILPWLMEENDRVESVLDMGTGAGFPAVPLAVMRPDWKVVALDGTAKKIAFLRQTCADLAIGNIMCTHAHSTHYKPGIRFDLVLTRAVGSLAKCLEASAHHTKPGGFMVAYKTPTVCDEWDEADSILRRHRLAALEEYPYELTLRGETLTRLLVPFRRTK